MNSVIHHPQSEPKNVRANSWLGIAGVVFMAVALFLAYALKQEGAVELQTAPWQTLLFIDNTTKNL